MVGLEIHRKFNITGSCNPDRHYMVDVGAKIEMIVRDYIMQGEYFTINRARQYGKTTTLALLCKCLKDSHVVIDMSFEGKDAYFESIATISEGIRKNVAKELKQQDVRLAEIWERPFSGQFPSRNTVTRTARS